MRNEEVCWRLTKVVVKMSRYGRYNEAREVIKKIRKTNRNFIYLLSEEHLKLWWLFISIEHGSYDDVEKILNEMERR